jgi:cytochrome c peroxidase
LQVCGKAQQRDDPEAGRVSEAEVAVRGAAIIKAADSTVPARDRRGFANEPPYFHHGRFTTIRQAVMAHAGEALEQRRAYERLSKYEQDAVIEFLKTLQVLPPGTKALASTSTISRRRGRPVERPTRRFRIGI